MAHLDNRDAARHRCFGHAPGDQAVEVHDRYATRVLRQQPGWAGQTRALPTLWHGAIGPAEDVTVGAFERRLGGRCKYVEANASGAALRQWCTEPVGRGEHDDRLDVRGVDRLGQ